jgi:hypothetical protein
MIGISLSNDRLGDFVAEHHFSFPAFTVSTEGLRAYRLKETPEVIVVSPAGKVLASWKGAFLGRTKAGIERFFAVHLPEI